MTKLFRAVEVLAVLMLLVLTFLIFLQVIMRNFLGMGFSWMEEIARYLLMSMVLIMGSGVVYSNEHVTMDFVSTRLPRRARTVQRMIVQLVILAFFLFYVRSHSMFMARTGTVVSPSLGLPNRLFFAAGLVGALLSVVAVIGRLIATLRGRPQ